MQTTEPHTAWIDVAVDRVDQASIESFPASDPPGWIPVRLGAGQVPPPVAIAASNGSDITNE
jgi:hypothetical protein